MQHVRPADDGLQRRPQLMRQGSQELVLAAAQRFGLRAGALFPRQERLAFRLNSPALGDVARDLRGADDVPRGTLDGRDGQRDVDPPTILCPPHRLEMVDDFAPADAGEHAVLLRAAVVRDDEHDVTADRFRGGVAEDPLCSRIPRHDDPVERLAHDRIVRRSDDRGQAFGHCVVERHMITHRRSRSACRNGRPRRVPRACRSCTGGERSGSLAARSRRREANPGGRDDERDQLGHGKVSRSTSRSPARSYARTMPRKGRALSALSCCRRSTSPFAYTENRSRTAPATVPGASGPAGAGSP